MSTQSLVLVIDGGGTSTTACVAGVGGSSANAGVLGQATADQSNPAVVGFERCLTNILSASESAIVAAQLEVGVSFERVAVGLAGIEATDFHEALQGSIGSHLRVEHVDVMTDIELLLLAASGERATVGIISGTGSVAVGRTLAGRSARSGGRGFLSGDAGSGFWIGQQGMTAAIRALDFIGPETQLVESIAAMIGCRDAANWTNYIYAGDKDPRTAVAACAPLVFQAAQSGDAVASNIVRQAGVELATLVLGVSKQLAIAANGYDAVLAGGVLVHQTLIREAMNQQLQEFQLEPSEQLIVDDPAVAVALRLTRSLT